VGNGQIAWTVYGLAFAMNIAAVVYKFHRDQEIKKLRSRANDNKRILDKIVKAIDKWKEKDDDEGENLQTSGLAPNTVMVVGDNHCDLEMGRNAGAGYVVGVLSGSGTRADLEPFADVIIDGIADFMDLDFGR
jgi:hypothetical protein